MAEQAKQLDTRFSSILTRLEATDNLLRALERKLELEHELTWSMVRETQMQVHQYRRQRTRIMVALAIAFVVLAVAGVLLLRGV
jgi:type IV secretory pathway component VirB8